MLAGEFHCVRPAGGLCSTRELPSVTSHLTDSNGPLFHYVISCRRKLLACASIGFATRANMADKPVNFVSWYDAIRFANWLQGAP